MYLGLRDNKSVTYTSGEMYVGLKEWVVVSMVLKHGCDSKLKGTDKVMRNARRKSQGCTTGLEASL